MKTSMIKISAAAFIFAAGLMNAQEDTPSMRSYLAPEKYSKNVFEDPKIEAPDYSGVKVTVGGDFALQFQSLKHSTEAASLGILNTTGGTTGLPAVPNTLRVMGSDFNLPTRIWM